MTDDNHTCAGKNIIRHYHYELATSVYVDQAILVSVIHEYSWVYNFIDINECKMSNGGCEHVCTNNNGSFFCTCNAGFILKNDTLSCAGNLTTSILCTT